MTEEKLISMETERACLAALIKYNDAIPDVLAFVKPDYFYMSVHSTIFSLITSTYQEKGLVDQILLVNKLKQLGISDVQGLDIYRYIEVIYNSPVNGAHVIDYYQELVKFHFLRKCWSSLGEASTYIKKNTDKSLAEVVNKVSGLVTDAATGHIETKDEIIDLYGELSEELSKRAVEQKEPSLITGFPVFDKWYGGLYLGDMYVFAAPAKRGKSTFLNYLSYKVAANPKNNVKILYLDTELETWRVMCRAASSLTEINEWYFKNGKFSKDSQMVRKVHEMFDSLAPVKGRVFHTYIGNRPIDDIISICRRWYVKNVKPGENAMICYDYIKLDGAKSGLSDHWKEYQEIGQKTDVLKKFASSVDNLVIVSSVQTNAECNIAMSKQITWFSSNVYILKPKEIEEIQEDGEDFGTHKLIEVVTRNQGEDAKGMANILKIRKQDGTEEFKGNYINFNFSKFKVDECGTLEDVIGRKAAKLPVKRGQGNAGREDIDF